MTPAQLRLKRARQLVHRIGYWNLINAAEAEVKSGDANGEELGRLRQALDISGCDDGVAVAEWYQAHRADRIPYLTGAFIDGAPRGA